MLLCLLLHHLLPLASDFSACWRTVCVWPQTAVPGFECVNLRRRQWPDCLICCGLHWRWVVWGLDGAWHAGLCPLLLDEWLEALHPLNKPGEKSSGLCVKLTGRLAKCSKQFIPKRVKGTNIKLSGNTSLPTTDIVNKCNLQKAQSN